MTRGCEALVVLALLACAERAPAPGSPPGASVALASGSARLDLRFPCGADHCAAWLYRPATPARPPVVVMGHGFAGTRDVGLGGFAEQFVAAGIAAWVFDYRGFGASSGAEQLVDPWRQIEDWHAALAAVRRRPDLDGSRAALWGSSMGGGHALIAATEDGGVRAVVAQVPLIDSRVEGEATFYGAGWAARLLLSAWADLARSWVGAEPLTIPALAPRDGFGMIVDDAAYAAFERLVEPSSSYRNAVAARSVLTFDEYNPAVQAESLAAPVLLIASPSDRFAPFSAVEAWSAPRANVRVEVIEGDHFEVYSPPLQSRAADLAVRFLTERLGP